MSYEPHQWVAGETVTPSKLNHIEQGIANGGGGVLFVTDDGNGTLSHTWQEVADAIENNQMVFLKEVLGGARSINGTIYFDYLGGIVEYSLYFNNNATYTANSANEYPSAYSGPAPD